MDEMGRGRTSQPWVWDDRSSGSRAPAPGRTSNRATDEAVRVFPIADRPFHKTRDGGGPASAAERSASDETPAKAMQKKQEPRIQRGGMDWYFSLFSVLVRTGSIIRRQVVWLMAHRARGAHAQKR